VEWRHTGKIWKKIQVSGRNATIIILNKSFRNVKKLGITLTNIDVVLV
jgi:hypothetical protein